MYSENPIKSLKVESDKPQKPKTFPPVFVDSVEEYFNLPKEKREKFGIYLKPFSLPFNPFDKEKCGFAQFKKKIRKEYPIQGWFREWFLSYNNPIYAFIKHRITDIKDIKYNIKHFFRPAHPRFRKVYPRHTWMDICEAIVKINFAMIQDFWHEEMYPDSIVDWHADQKHQEFYDWIKSAIDYIEIKRPELYAQFNKEMDLVDHESEKAYDIKYAKPNKIEKEIFETDKHILKQMIDYKDMFWT